MLAAALVSATALWWFHRQGYLLYYGDAAAHLNIARRVIDSRTPGYDQIGTVWLPVPHLAMMPLVGNTELWRSGLAGAIPAACANALAAGFLFLFVRRLAGSAAGWTAMACFLLNPNVLYLGSIPMSEPFLFCTLFGMLYALLRAKTEKSLLWAAAAGVAAMAGTLVRYEGWFVLPFAAIYLVRRGWRLALLFCTLAAPGPVFWILHNSYLEGDWLAFYRGPYSAKAIYQRALDAHMKPYPGDHNWLTAIRYFSEAARATSGWGLAVAGSAGFLVVGARARWEAMLLLTLPAFYVLSMYSSGTPIFLPHIEPYEYYNSRYGLAAIPALAAGAGFLGCSRAGLATIIVSLLPWLTHRSPEAWICWKESEVNSDARRSWTIQTSEYLKQHYRGGGIVTSFGDVSGIFQQSGIPLRETVNECNSPHFPAITARPDLFLREEWAVTMEGDTVDNTLAKAVRTGPRYRLVHHIRTKGAPLIKIYRLDSRAGLRPPTTKEIEESQRAWEDAEVR
ncbi:MAG: hypothetical protein FJW39_14205 [Acidobacteria bacterium]|nr:hypothetical protein [Acidobacteriota bacterium]